MIICKSSAQFVVETVQNIMVINLEYAKDI